jgi:hypothetical protein
LASRVVPVLFGQERFEGPARQILCALNAQKEQFSNAFIYAVASVAGCSVAKPSVDHDSVDWTPRQFQIVEIEDAMSST